MITFDSYQHAAMTFRKESADNDLSLSEIADKNIAKLEGRKARGTIGGSGDER